MADNAMVGLMAARDSAIAGRLAADLGAVGVVVRAVGGTDDLVGRPGESDLAFIIAVDEPGRTPALGTAAAACSSRGLPMLRVAADDDHVEVGPEFHSDGTACVTCLRRSQRDSGMPVPGAPRTGAALGQLGRLASRHVRTVLAGVRGRDSHRTLCRITAESGRCSSFLVVPYADCAVCGARTSAPSENGGLPEVYEWQMEKPARAIAPCGIAGEVVPAWLEDALAARSAMWRQRDVLPPSLISLGADTARPAVRTVAWMLAALADGYDPGAIARAGRHAQTWSPVRRWTPSGGDLASAELYLVPGGTGRVYRYDDRGHALVSYPNGSVPADECLRCTDLPRDSAAVVLFIAAFGRLARKYGRFAYRLAHLDAGCAATQLSVVARDAGLTLRFASAWDDRLPGLVGLDRRIEAVAAVAAVQWTEGSLAVDPFR